MYFWPGLEDCFREVCRVLKSGGTFLVVNESDGTDAATQKFEQIIDGMKAYTAEEIAGAMKAAGFSWVRRLSYYRSIRMVRVLRMNKYAWWNTTKVS